MYLPQDPATPFQDSAHIVMWVSSRDTWYFLDSFHICPCTCYRTKGQVINTWDTQLVRPHGQDFSFCLARH